MPKRRAVGGPDARSTILEATVGLLRERRTADITTEEIARRTNCAKGLVHYHFKRKDQLIAGAAEELWTARASAWSEALGLMDPKASIAAGWQLLEAEAANGTSAVCAAIGPGSDDLVVRSVNDSRRRFTASLTDATQALLRRMGLIPSVAAADLGALLGATIEGISLQLVSGAKPEELEQAWAAFWVGLLALTRRA